MSVFDEQAATPANEETTNNPEAGATTETTSYIEQLVKDWCSNECAGTIADHDCR